MKTTSDSQTRLNHPLLLGEERFQVVVEAVTDYAIILLDPRGIINSWNSGAQHISGYTADEVIGCHFSCLYPKESNELGWPEHELLVAKVDGRFEDEGWRVRKDGTRFWAHATVTALYDDRGELCGYSKITQDLTERRIYEETLRQSEERFRLLVEGVRDCAIFLLNPQGIVSSWNSGAETIKGYRAHEIIGRHFSTFYLQENIGSRSPEHELEIAKIEGTFEDENWRVRKNGSRFWAHIVITALHDSSGQLYGFAKLTRDMTDRKRIEALELAEQRTNEFLAMLSHELRNPLAPMRSALSVMQIAPPDDPAHARSRAVIERQVSHISRLVEDLVDVNRVTSGNIKLIKQAVDLVEVIARAVESSASLIETRRHTLKQRLPDQQVIVEGDLMRLTQVVTNLLNNAAQYTPEGGDIQIVLEIFDGQALIRVQDTGEGISRNLINDVFGLFVQGERTLDRAGGGLGIGLTLARRLVELQGGHIRAASEGINKGSEFVVELPLVELRPRRPVTPIKNPSGDTAAPMSLRILVVEDIPDVAEGMQMILELWGHSVSVVGDGVEALDAAPELHPDVVLLDIGLPGMSGYEVAKCLRALPELQHVTLIALTGYGQKEDRDRAFAAGFDHHLVKGESLNTLKKLLHDQRPWR